MVDLDPAQSEEQKGMSSALVLSTIAFNALGTVLVAPSRRDGDFARHAGFVGSLTGQTRRRWALRWSFCRAPQLLPFLRDNFTN